MATQRFTVDGRPARFADDAKHSKLAITPSLPAKGKSQSTADLQRSSELVDFYSGYYGVRYPFTSLGGIVTLQSFGLNLETQGKPTNAEYPISWRVAPADPKRPEDPFDADGIYRRAPASIEAIREILGNNATFKLMMRRWLSEHAYRSATTEQFIALVKRTDPSRAARWTEFFRQWLYTSYPTTAADPSRPPAQKPQINVDNFDSYTLPSRAAAARS